MPTRHRIDAQRPRLVKVPPNGAAMPAHFGAKLRWLRERNGLTQANLAQRIGLASHSHIAKVESGQDRPSLDLVIRIASLFGVTTDYLLRDNVPVEAIQLTVHESVGG